MKMKTGVIVYVVGKESLNDTIDFEEAGKGLDISADRIEVVTSMDGNFDVMHAWWLLTVKGMKLIVCMFAEVVNCSQLRLTGRELRLCG